MTDLRTKKTLSSSNVPTQPTLRVQFVRLTDGLEYVFEPLTTTTSSRTQVESAIATVPASLFACTKQTVFVRTSPPDQAVVLRWSEVWGWSIYPYSNPEFDLSTNSRDENVKDLKSEAMDQKGIQVEIENEDEDENKAGLEIPLSRHWEIPPSTQGDIPPQGVWVSRKAEKSYVYACKVIDLGGSETYMVQEEGQEK